MDYNGNIMKINNKDFQTIQIKVLFPFKNTINNLANMQLLPSLIGYKNKKYPTEKFRESDSFQNSFREHIGNSFSDLYTRRNLWVLSEIFFAMSTGSVGFQRPQNIA